MHFRICLLLLSVVLIASCYDKEPNNKRNDSLIIDIQPFAGSSNENVLYVINESTKIYPHIVLLKTINLPSTAFYPARTRYRADSLINFLNLRTKEGHVTIGLTNKDISTTKDSIADWGIMGLAFCPGKACI